jgi:hypothetical protein
MKMSKLSLAAVALAVAGALVTAAATRVEASGKRDKGEKPAASPGWIIIDEDYWFPLRYEPLYSLDAVSYHYRRGEEKAAANEIEKAVSWLEIAEGHAMPITKEKLTAAANELTKLAKDLRSGDIIAAARMNESLADAAQALAEWHFYRSKESWGKSEEVAAARELEMAAMYLQHAANSAHFQFGPETQKVIVETYSNGKVRTETRTVDHNTLGKHLQGIEKAVKELETRILDSTS